MPDWLRSRVTHAWGAIGAGLALIIGTVPLERELYPHSSSQWWVPAGLVLGAATLVFGLILLVLPGILSLVVPRYLPMGVGAQPKNKRPEFLLPDGLRNALADEFLRGEELYRKIDTYEGDVLSTDLDKAKEWSTGLEDIVRGMLDAASVAELRSYSRKGGMYGVRFPSDADPEAFRTIVTTRRYLDWIEDKIKAVARN